MPNKVSIVIPNYNRWDLVHQTLFDVYNKCSLNLIQEVIVINDGCTEKESFTGLQWWKETGMLPVREHRLTENQGFLLASNDGMKSAKGKIIALLSNDVRVYKDFVKLCIDMIAGDPKILMGGRYLNFDTGWNQFDGKIYPYLEGWFLAATCETWKELDYFDERYAPNDFEDVDLSTKAIKKEYSLISLPESFFQHAGGQSIKFGSEREKLTISNMRKFRAKWITKPSAKS